MIAMTGAFSASHWYISNGGMHSTVGLPSSVLNTMPLQPSEAFLIYAIRVARFRHAGANSTRAVQGVLLHMRSRYPIEHRLRKQINEVLRFSLGLESGMVTRHWHSALMGSRNIERAVDKSLFLEAIAVMHSRRLLWEVRAHEIGDSDALLRNCSHPSLPDLVDDSDWD